MHEQNKTKVPKSFVLKSGAFFYEKDVNVCTECQKLIKGAKAFDGSASFHPECMLVFYAVVFTLISPERYLYLITIIL